MIDLKFGVAALSECCDKGQNAYFVFRLGFINSFLFSNLILASVFFIYSESKLCYLGVVFEII